MSVFSPIDNDYKNGMILSSNDFVLETSTLNANGVNILDIFIPVNTILEFIDNTDPNKLYPNTTWELIKDEVYIGNDTSVDLGEIAGQDYINVIDSTNTGIYRSGFPPDKNKLELAGRGRHIEYTFKDKELKINNELPHVLVKAWKRTA